MKHSRKFRFLSLVVLTACGGNSSLEPPPGKGPPAEDVPPPPPAATSAALLFENLSRVLNESRPDWYEALVAPYFTFVEEATQTEAVGGGGEWGTVRFVFDHYLDVVYDLHVASRTKTDYGCLVVCGLVEMRIFRTRECGFIVYDETCFTACPRIADELWYLTEWRIVRSVPPARKEEGFEAVSWGHVRRTAEEAWIKKIRSS